ncbi:RNA pseudouridine synthase family protein [Marinomonas sp. MED121]|uniref:RluA family pseudouridine synthase n=1 Tax=Marinomonas sp. MED121 TaxID=314277 RepID=UPI00006901E9|nr:RluA family pseudouridine synthase [Marinomonas sp. MED121]EAQ64428.1 RNA pseudouridine synthase family protein [Marinomonas sp. MED121]
MDSFERHIKVDHSESSILSLLSDSCDLSAAEIKNAIAKGALWIGRGKKVQRLRRVKKALKVGEELHFYYNPKVLDQIVPEAKLVADLVSYSVWYKPYGMLSQGSKWSDHTTISRWAQTHLTPERPVFIVHRLDRAATGLIIIAHTKAAARALSGMFEQHALEKHYQIIVHGNHSEHDQPEVITQEIDGKSAQSTFNCLEHAPSSNLSLIDVKIDSGRKHQIRLHAAGIGLPVVADRLHGDKSQQYADDLNLQLCAVTLDFTCPLTGEERSFKLDDALRPNLKSVAAKLV